MILLEAQRRAAGFTRAELAKRAGVDRRLIHYLETGKVQNPRIDTVKRLADALGVAVSDLLGGDNGQRQ